MGFLDFFKKRKINIENYEENYEEDKFNEELEIDNVIDEIEVENEVEESNFNLNNEDNKDNEVEITKEDIIETKVISGRELDEIIIGEILKVINNYDGDFDVLKITAKEATKNITDKYLDVLPSYLSGKVPKSSKVISKYDDINEWNIVVENAVLMIIFSYNEKAIPILQKIYQENEGLKLKSLNLLCKIASENVETESIVNWIVNDIMSFNDDDKIIIFGFMSQIKNNNQVIGIIQYFYKEFVKSGNILKGYQTLVKLINAAERYTKGHLNFLKSIALGKTILNLEKIMGIDDGDEKIIKVQALDENEKINAAITYYSLDNEDEEINNKLEYLSEYCLDKDLRMKIKAIIS